MAIEVETLLVKLEGRITDFEKKMDRATRKADTAARKINASFSGIKSFGAGLAGGFLGALSAPALLNFATSAVKAAADLNDLSQRVGVTTDDLQKLQFAATQSGTSVDDLNSSVTMFVRRIADASQGAGELFQLLRANNVALTDSAGRQRDVADLMGEVADLMARATNAQDRMNIAVAAFGKSGANMVNVLSNGRAGLAAFGDEAVRIGAVMDESVIKKAAELDDKFDALARTLGTALKTGAIQGADAIVGMAESLNTLGQSADDLFNNPNWANFLKFMFGGLADEVGGLVGVNTNPMLSLKRPTNPEAFGIGGSRQATAASTPSLGPLPVIPSALSKAAEGEANRLTKSIKDEIDQLKFQGDQLSRTSREQAIYNSLQQAGVDISTAAGQRIAEQAGKTYDLELAMSRVVEQAELFRDVGNTGLGTFVRALRDGKSAADAFGDALGRMADKLLDAGLGQLGSALFGGGLGSSSTGTGLLGALFGIGGARAGGGPMQAGKFYKVGEHGTELFRPNTSGVLDSNRRMSAATGGDMNVSVYGANGDAQIMEMVKRGVVAGFQVEGKRFASKVSAVNRAPRRRQL